MNSNTILFIAFFINNRRRLTNVPPYLTMARQLGIWQNTNRLIIPSARQSNRQDVNIETKWSRNSTDQTPEVWHGLQSIMAYKRKASPVADTDVLLLDKLNNFFARFEDNT